MHTSTIASSYSLLTFLWFPHNCKQVFVQTLCKIAYMKPRTINTKSYFSTITDTSLQHFRKCAYFCKHFSGICYLSVSIVSQVWVLLSYHCNTAALPSPGYSITLQNTITSYRMIMFTNQQIYIRSVGFMSYSLFQ